MLSNDVRKEERSKLEKDIFHYPILPIQRYTLFPLKKCAVVCLYLNLLFPFDLLTFDAESNYKTAQLIKDGLSYSL